MDGERRHVKAGGIAYIPAGVKHAFINRSDGESVIHFELIPSGQTEAFFGKLIAGEFEDPGEFFEAHGLKLLGPPISREPSR